MSESGNKFTKGKKRSKAYYLKCSKQFCRHKSTMEPGQKGFLVTCNNRERDCIRETYSLLNKYADKLYGPEMSKPAEENPNAVDIEEEVKREVESLKESLQTERRFQALESGARNCIFIKSNVPDPSHLIHTILMDIQSTQKPCSRNVLRATPVLSVCRASLDDIKSSSKQILPNYFKDTGPNGKTFAVIFKVRNNSTLGRNSVIGVVGTIVAKLDHSNKVDLNAPELVILVDVIGKCCCLGIVQDYYKLKKYNLAELILKTDIKDVCAKDGLNSTPLTTETSSNAVEIREKENPDQKLDVKNETPDQKLDAKQENPDQKLDEKQENPDQKLDAKQENPDQKLDAKQENPDQKLDAKQENPDQKLDAKQENPDQKLDAKQENPDQKLDAKQENPDQKLDAKQENPDQKLDAKQENPDQKLDAKQENPDQKLDAKQENPDQKLDAKQENPDQKLDVKQENPDQKLDTC